MDDVMVPKHKVWLQRVLWLVALWAASILVLGMVAYGIRLFMQALGLHA